MLRRFIDFQLSFFEKGKRLHRFRPLVSALDTFCYEPKINLKKGPFIRDAVDVKRWMVLVIIALIPTLLMAIWNTGVQQFVYGSSNASLLEQFYEASRSFSGYFRFVFSEGRFWPILGMGCAAFLPVLIVSYVTGLLIEGIFACLRGHEIAEGFLVTGMLIPLILPPTIPLWMVAVGTAFGVIIGKELFGGTGMNILNVALTTRAFLFFTFPGNLSGDIWIGEHPIQIERSIQEMNTQANLSEIDGFSQATVLQGLNAAVSDIKKIHVDAIATNTLGEKVATYPAIARHFKQWSLSRQDDPKLGALTPDQLKAFLTTPRQEGGLGLSPGLYVPAYRYVETRYGFEKFSFGNLFWGNIPGSMGETSTAACLIGAIFLILVGVGSWRTMVAVALGALITALLFQFFSSLGADGGAWNSAKFSLPAYRQLVMGGLAFGLVYMATDPVSSPGMDLSKWIYGALIGMLTIVIREINPAYPEGVMLAILFANVFAPLIDYYVVRGYRRGLKRVRAY